jgi:hypothetical protein
MENIKEVVINSEEFKKLYEDIIPALNGFVNEYLIPLSRENNQELDNDNVIIYLGNWIHERFKKCNESESSNAIEPGKEDNRVIVSEPEGEEIDVIASEPKEKEIHSNKKEGNSINEDSKSNRPKRKTVIRSYVSSSEEEEYKKNKKRKKKVNEESKTNNDLEIKTKKNIPKESDNAELFAKELTTYLETKEKEVKDKQESVGSELITHSNELTLETNNQMMNIGSFVLDHLKIEQEINHAETIQITATKNFYGKLYEGYLMKERQIRHLKSIRNSRHANFLEEFGIDVGTGDTDKQVRNTII